MNQTKEEFNQQLDLIPKEVLHANNIEYIKRKILTDVRIGVLITNYAKQLADPPDVKSFRKFIKEQNPVNKKVLKQQAVLYLEAAQELNFFKKPEV